ncbi:MAG: rRNA maturation RNase YbeY [Candidatus Hydrogenedentes bacterium]|nr:rRNA maturation RNase YbeY [Candidatus Hydrogenedentota bacterium]
MLQLDIQNNSTVKRLYRHRTLHSLAQKICFGEEVQEDIELSVLFCDDPFIQELNQHYRGKNKSTDVLSFQQETPVSTGLNILGDIVISLETVQRFCKGERVAMGDEMRLLFCHGLLHLLGHTHTKQSDQNIMLKKQAQYLDIEVEDAWHS